MKGFKKLSIFLSFVLIMTSFVGCGKKDTGVTKPAGSEKPVTQPVEKELTLPDAFPMEMSFLSGAGGWSTGITLKPDGTFVGSYSDSEMGIIGDGYPNGTVYVCEFTGKFDIVEKIDKTSYSLKLADITTIDVEGKEWISDGIKYIASVPYGLEEGKDFVLYTPDKKLDDLSEGFLSWWPLRYDAEEYSTLSVYGLHNLETDYGFFESPY